MNARTRALPWTALLEALGEERLSEIRAALDADRVDPLDTDAFLLHRAPGAVFRDLVPEDGASDAVNAYGTLLHMMYVMWTLGWPVATASPDAVRSGTVAHHASPITHHPSPVYLQLPERLVWSQRDPAEPHEPIDGAFILPRGNMLHLQAILGMHDLREGFTTMEVSAPLPLERPGPRDDGTPAFAPTMHGGDRARLISVVNASELSWLLLNAVTP